MTKEELTTEMSKILNEIKTTYTAYANAQNNIIEVMDRFESLADETLRLFSEEEFMKMFITDLEEIQKITEITAKNHVKIEDIYNL